MKPEIGDKINILGRNLRVISFLGKGKGGYSYLVRDRESNNYTLKCFHDESVSYYTFSSSKISLELNAYMFLSKTEVKIPRLLYWDEERDIILKEYIKGETMMERVKKGDDLSPFFPCLHSLSSSLALKGVNLDWFPTNFIESKNDLYYIDYEIAPYSEEWSFSSWGINYWKDTKALREYLSTD